MSEALALRDDMFTRARAAAYIGATVTWLERHARDGKGPVVTRSGGRVYYLQADLDDYLQRSRDTECSETIPRGDSP